MYTFFCLHQYYTHIHLVAEKQVAQFEIPVNDVVVVQILDAQSDLSHEVTRFWFGDGLAPLVQLHQRTAATQLQQDVHVLVVLEETEELDDVVVFERLMNGDFLRHFLFGMLFDEKTFGDDFAGEDLIRFQVFEFVTAGESAFAHEFALLVFLPRGFIHDQVGHLAKGLPTRRRHGRSSLESGERKRGMSWEWTDDNEVTK